MYSNPRGLYEPETEYVLQVGYVGYQESRGVQVAPAAWAHLAQLHFVG